MGINQWRDRRGRQRIYLSKQWPDGSRFRRVMPNKTVARQLEARIVNAIVLGTWIELRKELNRGNGEAHPTLAQFRETYLEHCQGRNRDLGFKQRNTEHIVRILGDLRLMDFKRVHADTLVKKRLKEGACPATVNRTLAVLKHMISLALEREYLEVHPLLRYRMLPEVQEPLRIMTYQEYRRLIRAVAEEDLVIGVYSVVLGETGMRKSEALRLKWTDIYNRMLAIGKAKSGKVRSVPLSDLAAEWLGKLVRFMEIPNVFVNPQIHRPWKDPRGPFDAGKARVGLKWVTFHDLRHFRATQWLMKGVDVNTVKELLGHSSIQTTMRYVHYVHSHATRSVQAAQKREVREWKNGEKSLDENLTTCES